MDDAPMLPMPELMEPIPGTYTVEWRMTGKLTLYGPTAAAARENAARFRPQMLVVLSDDVVVEVGEPKDVGGE